MNSKTLFFLLLIIGSTVITACKKELSGTVTKKDINNLKVEPFDFEYLTTRSKIRFQDDDTNIGLTATIRIKKDSIIWLSLSPAFGIEAARGMITQDSMVIINRLNREYMVFDFKALSKKYNITINYDLIQAMLLGNMPVEQSVHDQISKAEDHFIIHQITENFTVDNFINALNMRPERVQLADLPSENTLTLIYSEFQMLADALIPYSNKVILNYRKNDKRLTALIDIDHGKAEIADASLGFPFNIPQTYERK